MSFPCVLITWKLLLKSNPEGHAGRRWPFPEGHWSLGREDESTSCENRLWHGLVMGGGPVLWGGLLGEQNWKQSCAGAAQEVGVWETPVGGHFGGPWPGGAQAAFWGDGGSGAGCFPSWGSWLGEEWAAQPDWRLSTLCLTGRSLAKLRMSFKFHGRPLSGGPLAIPRGCVCGLPGGARWRTRLLDATETRDDPVAGGTGWPGPDTCWLGRCQNEFTSK